MATINLGTLNTSAATKVNTLEDSVANSMTTIGSSGSEISQSDLISLQYRMNALSTFTSLISSLNKEISDIYKGVISKF